MLSFIKNWNSNTLKSTFWVFSIVLLCSLGISILWESIFLMIIPLSLIVVFIAIGDFQKLMVLFFLVLPFSIEIFLPSGLGTDLPTEPLAIMLTIIAIILFLNNIDKIDLRFIRHPISLIIIVQLIWIIFSAIVSQNQVISFKFFLAKLWYVIPFFFLPFYLIRKIGDIEKYIKILILATSVVLIIILIKHAGMGFTFKSINKAAHPIFRNHVIYAALLVIILPFVYHFKKMAKSINHKLFWTGLLFIFFAGIYFSFTRAAHLCVFVAIGGYFIIKYKLSKYAIGLSLIASIVVISFLIKSNKYLDFAPDYHKTITHINFDNLLEATFKMEDISTMERVYRWVSGLQMAKERPLLGFGPGCFYPYYKNYSVSQFKTYVSDNPDKSGIHNYYFMTMIEQGILGFLIILFLCFFPIIYGESIYHKINSKRDKSLIMASILSLIVIDSLLLINDLLETDKLGSIFLFNLSILVIIDFLNRSKKPIELNQSSSSHFTE